ncbi:hypothetical protein [Streptomyces sp. NPDC056634]|uniref:hypothetical protein n=1 Tax=Streptomyces sp. NPDC056634 TaxID=3345885 RepID=UPI0036A5126F
MQTVLDYVVRVAIRDAIADYADAYRAEVAQRGGAGRGWDFPGPASRPWPAR